MATTKQRATVARVIQAAQREMVSARRALDAGDCAEAIDAVIAAYAWRGKAEGYVLAQRKAKGRRIGFAETPAVAFDKRFDGLHRLKVQIRRTCSRA